MRYDRAFAGLSPVFTARIATNPGSDYVQFEADFNGKHYARRVEWRKIEAPPYDLIEETITRCNLFAKKAGQ